MQGIIRAVARLLVMAGVMAAVVVAALVAGVGTTTAIAIGIVLAGVVGLFGVAKRPQKLTGVQEIEAMLANDPLEKRVAPKVEVEVEVERPTAVEAMAPAAARDVDPEAGMPRWRRPSLLEARRSDPTRPGPISRIPMLFSESSTGDGEIRVVRYAVVPVLDRPDEVLGRQLSDLGSGDEVQVVAASGAFLEVVCPNGDQGWIHRTTLTQRGSTGMAGDPRQTTPEADDALSALLTARGLA
jgi:hypothetical protein